MIFVFGSNLAGRHGAGAALTAKKYHGAIVGVGAGLQGQSYAIPTKDEDLSTLNLPYIAHQIRAFITFAESRPDLSFQVTRVGCGLAGYQDEHIAPLFRPAPVANCFFDSKWRPFLGNEFEYWGTF